jgi:hypothetical protein
MAQRPIASILKSTHRKRLALKLKYAQKVEYLGSTFYVKPFYSSIAIYDDDSERIYEEEDPELYIKVAEQLQSLRCTIKSRNCVFNIKL